MNYVARLLQKYSLYQTRVTSDGDTFSFVILNPNQNSDIVVDNTSGFENELTFYFSYQHAHFGENINALMEYIDLFLTDTSAAIEFFQNGERSFGGDISLHGIDLLSIDYISRKFGYKPSNLVGLSYKVRTWSGGNDLDAIIVEEGGHAACKKTKLQ